jgi:hypothetical protein
MREVLDGVCSILNNAKEVSAVPELGDQCGNRAT